MRPGAWLAFVGLILAGWPSPVRAATAVYYSVGTSAADLKAGSPTLTITAGVGTFSLAQPDNVGVGDQVSYGGASVAYISGRLGPTQYTLITATGATPANVTNANVSSILRAFNSLTAAEAGSTNASHLNLAGPPYDLVAADVQLNWPCYNDGFLNDVVTVSGYTTGPAHYIRIYTPKSTSEVGASQRHRGTFGTGFRVGATNDTTLRVFDAYIRIEGLEIQVTSTTAGSFREGIRSFPAGVSDVRISHNIVKGVSSGNNNADPAGIVVGSNDLNVHRVSNNIVYNFRDNLQFQRGIHHTDGTAYIFNNTVFGCALGFVKAAAADTLELRNNVSINFALNAAYVDYSFISGLESHNVSSDVTAAGTGSQTGKAAYASYFTNTIPGDEDLHLRTSSLNLWGSNGASLSVDPNLPVTDDIDGAGRGRPDIGADESGPVPGPQMLVKSGRYTGNAVDDRFIYVGFQPDMVLVKRDVWLPGDPNAMAVVRTSTMGVDQTKSLDNLTGLALFSGGIKTFTASGFTIGTSPRVNDIAGDTYDWVAFKAATGQMTVATYTGNLAGDNRSVTGIGFQPEFVIVLPAAGGLPSGQPRLRSGTMPADLSYDLDANGGANYIQIMEPDGFQVGTNYNVNGATYHYIAWNATPGRMVVESYAGNGIDPTDRDVVGFQPEWLLIKQQASVRPWQHKPASTGVGSDSTLALSEFSAVPGSIKQLRPQGFRVGSHERVNSVGNTYHWAAFGPHSGGVNLRSIGPAADTVAGTVQATSGSTQVLGTGTAWRTANRGRGDRMQITGSSIGDYTVASVASDTVLYLTVPYQGTDGAGKSYSLQRKFAHPSLWEDCVDGPLQAACGALEAGATLVSSGSLVTDDRSEVGILYNDDGPDGDLLPEPFVPLPLGQPIVNIGGMTTDATHTVSLTVDPGNRHAGVAWSGAGATPHVVFNNSGNGEPAVRIGDDFVTAEWLELHDSAPNTQAGFSMTAFSSAITPSNGSLSSTITLRNNVLHDLGMAFDIGQASLVMDIYDNVAYRCDRFMRMDADQAADPSLIRVLNNTAWGCSDGFHIGPNAKGRVLFRNNIASGSSGNDFWLLGSLSALSSHNLSEDGTAGVGGASPGGGGQPSTPMSGGGGINFVSTTLGAENLHLQSNSWAIDKAAGQGALFGWDIDGATRTGTWDIGADEFGATTAVKLQSFVAVAGDAAVTLEWRTASELDNLGFHVYRGASSNGPWARLTPALIPGLGSSAVGQSYAFRDAGLVNGTRYFYRLEDVDASSKVTSHGPVSAVPLAGAAGGAPGGDAFGGGGGRRGGTLSCPDWVLAAYGASAGEGSGAAVRCTRHGDPEAVSLEVVSRDSRQATLELRTGGFYALHAAGGGGPGTAGASGAVRVFISGFDFAQDAQASALPFRRALVDAVVGRRVQLGRVRGLEWVGFKGLVPVDLGKAEMQVSWDGTVRVARRAAEGVVPPRASIELARLLPPVFQGEAKSAVVEIAPLRYDARRQQIVLAKRVLVKLLFTGRETEESGRGRFGRRERPEQPVTGELLSRLYTTGRGLHVASFEQLFTGRARDLAVSQLRLERQGQPVALHVEPRTESFGPGSRLYFFAERAAASTDFSGEVAYELVRSREGVRMPLVAAAPAGEAVFSAPAGMASFETNRFYQPGLLEAEDVWQWEGMPSGATRVKSFTLGGVEAAAGSAAELTVYLQGASESGQPIDHHVAVSVNGVLVGETQFAGKKPYRMSLGLPASLLRAGANELQLTNVANTGVSSYVFLDRFTIAHPQLSSLAGGRWEGVWSESGSVSLQAGGAVSEPVVVVDVTALGTGAGTNGAGNGTGGAGTTGTTGPGWLTGHETTTGGVRFRVETGHRYWVGSDSALFSPRVSQPQPSGLKSAVNQADYLLIAPRAFLAASAPLLARRMDQGLTTRAVAFEEIADEFGHGRPSAEAIKGFLAYAYHSWAGPSPRYVVLLGDSSYDPRNFIGSSKPSPLPVLWAKTSYLWTATDAGLVAVNGEDELPDLAIGRLPAATLEEAERLVSKLLAWEESGQGLGGQATLVADNPDLAGDFEANVREVAASYLAGRSELLLLSELGAGTRPRIREALDAGRSYLDYVGHGGVAVWASENVWGSSDVAGLREQSEQPLLLTMNCLNGYFVAPAFDSLSEALVKAAGRGAIAAFSPSGLSLDGPAHQYHRALMGELTGGGHARLGDAVLAAQRAYAQTGLMPELLSIYHLLGDPAMPIR